MIDQDKNERKDIISFYNEVYIKVMKEYIIAMKNSQPEQPNVTRTPIINNSGTLTPGYNKSQI